MLPRKEWEHDEGHAGRAQYCTTSTYARQAGQSMSVNGKLSGLCTSSAVTYTAVNLVWM